MPIIAILVSEEDMDAANEIAVKMFPQMKDIVDHRNVLGTAAHLGIEQLKLMYGLKEEK